MRRLIVLLSVFIAVIITASSMAAAATYSSTNVPLTIPDNGSVNSTLSIADTGIISDVNVTVNISHAWISDIQMYLISPAGTSIQLINRQCTNQDNIVTTFDDESGNAAGFPCPVTSASYRPEVALSTLDGQNINGTWTLRVMDVDPIITGTLNSWSIDITPAVDNDGDNYAATVDCNDNNPAVHPGAAEADNGTDDNCNSQVDEGLDVDGDGFTPVNGNDCNDGDTAINPTATEVFNGIDDNCNGVIDETFADVDGDGYPVPGTDCNDSNAAVHPGATEIPGNGLDDDCDGLSTAAPVVIVPVVVPPAAIFDGRENAYDLAAPVAIYAAGNGVDVYWWTEETRTGAIVIHMTAAEVDAIGVPATENVLLATSADGSVRLYRLTTGEYQVNVDFNNVNDGYVFIWHEEASTK